jgi:hypothetical protein
MNRSASVVVGVVLACSTLAACGGPSEYCQVVEQNQAALKSFGKKKTDKAFKTYRQTVNEISKVAPESVKSDWSALTRALVEVKDAHKAAGVSMQDISQEAINTMGAVKGGQIVTAYENFNDAVSEHGAKTAESVAKECGIDLK